jgi:hypothetical protein
VSIPHAGLGEVADVRPLGAALAATGTKTLVKADALGIVRLVVPAGKEITLRFTLASGGPFAFAGLWDAWQSDTRSG